MKILFSSQKKKNKKFKGFFGNLFSPIFFYKKIISISLAFRSQRWTTVANFRTKRYDGVLFYFIWHRHIGKTQ